MKEVIDGLETVSIIIPIYNSEKYLNACLESICNQTYKKLDIILVDDGSTDASAIICEKFKRQDQRIRVFNNSNHGVSYSRNYGLKKAYGNYIIFVDSDDICQKSLIQELYYITKAYDLEICACSYYTFTDKEKITVFNSLEKSCTYFYTGYETLDFICDKKKSWVGFVWNKLYKRQVIISNNIFFDESVNICEDSLFNVNVLIQCSKVAFINSPLYNYRIRNDGLTLNNNPNKFIDKIKVSKLLYMKAFSYPFTEFLFRLERNYFYTIVQYIEMELMRNGDVKKQLQELKTIEFKDKNRLHSDCYLLLQHTILKVNSSLFLLFLKTKFILKRFLKV